MTYTEQLGRRAVNWHNELDRASELYSDAFLSLYGRSLDWIFCPCGAQSADIPRSEDGSPKDEKLLFLGRTFPYFVRNKMWTEAKYTLGQIEVRSEEILNLLYGN